MCRCYVRALKLMCEVPSLWHDLGLNYYHQSRLPCVSDGEKDAPCLLLEKAQEVTQKRPRRFRKSVIPIMNKALFLQCLKRAVMLESGSHNHWNALGVVSMSKGNVNLAPLIATGS